MSESKLERVDINENSITVLSHNLIDGLRHQIEQYNSEFSIHINSEEVYIFYADRIPDDATKWQITEHNLMYYRTDLSQRDLTEDEKEWCDSTLMYAGDSKPDTIYYFTVPKLGDLKQAIKEKDLEAFDKLEAGIPDIESIHQLSKTLQKDIAKCSFRMNQLEQGLTNDLNAEWTPKEVRKDKSTLYSMAKMERSGYLKSWREIFKIPYYDIKRARNNTIREHNPYMYGANDPSYYIVELDILDKTSSHSYCRICSTVHRKFNLIYPEKRGDTKRTIRVCPRCAERKQGDLFESDSVRKKLS